MDLSILKKERKSLGITQTEMAEKCHTSQTYISQIETGRCLPSLYLLEKISKCLGKKLKIIIYEEL